MRDDYLAPFWAEHHGLWADFIGDALRRAASAGRAILGRAGAAHGIRRLER